MGNAQRFCLVSLKIFPIINSNMFQVMLGVAARNSALFQVASAGALIPITPAVAAAAVARAITNPTMAATKPIAILGATTTMATTGNLRSNFLRTSNHNSYFLDDFSARFCMAAPKHSSAPFGT